MQQTHKSTSFQRLALAAAAALSMAGTAVVAAEVNDADMPWGSLQAATLENSENMREITRKEVREEAIAWTRQHPGAGVGEADTVSELQALRDAMASADDDATMQALRNASANADDASTGAFLVHTDEGPMLLIVTDDVDAPYSLVALKDAVILSAFD